MNQLKHRLEFEQLLSNYRLPVEVSSLLEGMNLVLLVGPSASGRNTIINELISKGGYTLIVSDTTRSPRFNNGVKEENGVEYWFRSEEEFLKELKQGEFLEAEVIHGQQVSGISIRELKRVHDSGNIAVTDVDIGGFNNVLSRKPDTVGVYILPPSFEVWLQRLSSRSELPPEEIINRIKTGLIIYRSALKATNARIVINDELGRATQLVDKLAHGQREDDSDRAKAIIPELIRQTTVYLAEHDS
jgi:guanylate kinase